MPSLHWSHYNSLCSQLILLLLVQEYLKYRMQNFLKLTVVLILFIYIEINEGSSISKNKWAFFHLFYSALCLLCTKISTIMNLFLRILIQVVKICEAIFNLQELIIGIFCNLSFVISFLSSDC